MKYKEAEILRRYIKESLLLEDETVAGVNLGLGYFGQLDPSSIRAGQKGIKKAFKDITDTGAAAVEKTASAISRVLKIGAAGILELLSFGKLKPEYDKIHKEFDNEIKQINSKYKEAIQDSWEVLGKEAPLMAVLGLPAALTIKTAVENPKLFGAVAALAGVGGADALVAKATSILGLPGAAATAATATIGSKAGEALSDKLKNESRKRNFSRIILEETSKLTSEQQKELETLIPQIKAAAMKGAKMIETDVNAALTKLTKNADALTSKVNSAMKKTELDEKQKAAATNVFQSEQEKLQSIKQSVFGDKPSPALDASLSKATNALGSVSSAESDKRTSTSSEKLKK